MRTTLTHRPVGIVVIVSATFPLLAPRQRESRRLLLLSSNLSESQIISDVLLFGTPFAFL